MNILYPSVLLLPENNSHRNSRIRSNDYGEGVFYGTLNANGNGRLDATTSEQKALEQLVAHLSAVTVLTLDTQVLEDGFMRRQNYEEEFIITSAQYSDDRNTIIDATEW